MKKVNELLRKIGGVVLAVIVLTAQMPVTAFAEEPAAVELETAVAADEDLPIGDSEAGAEAAGEAGSEAAEKAVEETAADKESSDNEDSEEAEKSGDEGESSAKGEKDGDSEEKKYPAFSESKSIDGVRITVEADEGVFPEGATLSVEKVTVAQEKQAEEAVESERGEDKQVAVSYTYDIKVLDKDGNELQPVGENGEDSSSRVKVSFKLDEVADENLETNVYHIKEANTENTEGSSTREKGADSGKENEGSVDCESGGTDSDDTDSNVTGSETTEFTAEKLPVETDGDTATAETDGFSLYTVEFTYDSKQYVLPGDSEVALSEVLDTVGLTGEVSDVEVSNESLFSAKKCKTAEDGSTPEKDEDGKPIEAENGTWFVFAHQAFSSEEWIKVTIGGVVYEITVTDDNATADLTIATIDEWKTFARNVASGTDYSGETVALGDDLDFSGTTFTYEYIVGFLKSDSGYNSGSKSFKGTFDGNGHTIKNVTITANTDALRVGCLFYKNEGMIRNTVFDNITITALAKYAGFIAHTNAGTIDGCTISGTMNLASGGYWMGGVVYTNSGTIQNCYVNVKDPNGNVVYNNDNNGKGTLTNVYCTSDCTGTKQGTVVYKFVAVENGGISSLTPTTEPVCTFGSNKYYTADTGVTFNAEVESSKTADPIYCNGVPVSKNSDGSYTFTVAEEDVKVQTKESLPDRTITCANASGGTMSASPSTAHAYEEITLTATPENGYLLNGITATTSDSKSVNVNYEPWYKQVNTASFRMPDADVTVTPTFTAINNTSNEFSINLPKTGTETATIPSGVVSFKVYDHAGASGNYGTYCNGTLTLTAPTGYGFQISGSVDVEGNSYGYQVPVSISDGTNTIYSATRVNTTLSPIICNSNTLTIEFISDNQACHNDHAGLDLTVSLINLSQTHNITIGSTAHGTMTSDVASAKAGTKVTLTAAPATDGNTHYMLEGVSVTYTENDTTKNIAVDGGWWTNNVLTFTMPYSDVVVTPTFVEGNADGGPNINGLTYVGKTDTEQGYYKIDSPTALNALAAYVNGGGRSEGMLFKQTADIDMSGQGYTPIGSSTNNPFNGTYDGDGYVILNISHTDDGSSGKSGQSGMFGKIANGTVKNVNLKNCNFTGLRVGGIAGYMNGGAVTNCSVIGGTVSCGANRYSGGIVGYFDGGTVKDCFAANTITANSADTEKNGPIVGWPCGYTDNNYYTVAVSGGNSTGTEISGGFVTVGEGVTIKNGVFRTIGRTKANTYYFCVRDDVISFSAEDPAMGMKKFTTTAGALAGTSTAGTVSLTMSLTMPASDVTVSLADVTPTISGIDNQTYTGSAIEPTATVKDGDATLIADTNYTLSYSNNTAVGTATVTITGKGVYLGTASTTFEIKKASINPVVSIEGWTYGDTANTPSVTGNPGNGAVTYEYKFRDAEDRYYSGTVPKNIGNYIVKAIVAETDNYASGTATADFTITPKSVTITGLSVSDKEYDGTIDATVTGTAAIDGKVGDDDITVTAGTAAFADKNVGEGKTVTFSGYSLSGTAAGNYTLSAQPASMTANITPKEVTVGGITANNKTFDGTTAATVGCSSASLSGVVGEETVTISGATGSFADANVGDDKTVTLNYTDATLGGADGGNYKLAANGNQAAATANIIKAAAAAVPAINRTYLYTAGGSDSIDIAALLPPNRGTTSYTITKSSEVTFSADPAVTDGVLAYTVAPGDLNKTGTITVTAETQNYENITVTVNIKLADQKPVELKSGTSVTLNKSTLTYGEALSTLTFKANTAVFVEQGNTGNVIPGTIDWKTPSEKPAAGTTSAAWVFTPTDTTYASLEGTVSIAVDKATLEITTVPTASAITYGQTLNESTLTGGAATLNETNVNGDFTWSDTSITPTVADSNKTEYTVKFTPDDTTNYNGVTCKVKLTVNKADITADQITPPAKIEGLKYTGQALSLITAGSVTGNTGTMEYALGTDAATAPTSGWTTTIPTATNAGTYYVWYKVIGDANHNDVAAAGPLTVDIAKAHFTNITASGNTKYGLAGTIELKEHIAPGGTVGSLSITDADSVLEGTPVLTGTVLSYSFKSVSENVGKSATVIIPVTNATNYKDYSITATLNVINCEHPNTELRNIKEATCTEKGCKGDLYCTECNSLLLKGEEIPINPDNHAFVLASVVSSPDSMTGEIRTYRCSRCGKTYTDPLITSPKTDENGNTTESVAVGGVTVEEVTVDKTTGKETVSTRVWVSGLNSSYTYTGAAIKPSFKVYSGTTLLKEGTDYSVSYKNNKNAGTAYVYIKFKGNYKDTKTETLSFSIAAAKLGEEVIAHQVGVAEKKKAQKPVPVLTWADTGKKVSSQYFNISYSPATVKTAGEYTATITPKSGTKNFTGSTTAKVVVTDKAKLLSSAKVTFSPKSYAYTGGEITPSYTLTLGGITLTEGRDYKRVSLCNNIKPGNAAVIFEGMNGYYGSKTASFKISGRIELDNSSDFTYTYSSSVTYVKGGAKPAVSVKDNKNGVTLTEGTDYTLSYSKNKAVTNSAVIKVKGKGSYKGTVTLYFAITQQSLSALEGNIHAADQFVVKKKLKKPTVTIYDLDGKKLSVNRDFTVGAAGTPSGDEKSGTVTVTVYGIGAYTGQAVVTYRYMEKSANISAARLRSKIADQEYTGNAIKLSYAELTNKLYISGSGTSKNLVPGTDFVIASYSSNIKNGTAKVTIRGIGAYAGTKTLSFKIVQRKVNYAGKLWN